MLIHTSTHTQAAIDLDQKDIESQLGLWNEQEFLNARGVYEEGGHSKSIADITLSIPLFIRINEGTLISGESSNTGLTVLGMTLKLLSSM